LKLHKELLEFAARLEADGQVESPVIAITSEVVFEALKDAEILLRSSGPKNAVDRAHTALHGYLKKLCLDRGEVFQKEPSLTRCFQVCEKNFPNSPRLFHTTPKLKEFSDHFHQPLTV